MRVILWVILALVIAVLIWAFSKNAFVDNSIFGLALIAVGLCGYLIADFVYSKVKKSWESDQTMYKNEISALKEDKDMLQKQLSSATPQAEVDEMKKKLYHSEEENRKLSNDTMAQAGNLSATNARLERLLVEYTKLKEDTTVTTVSQSTELDSFKETLAITKNKLQDLLAENERLKTELSSKTPAKSSRVGEPVKIEPQPTTEPPVKFLNENGNGEIDATQRIRSRSVSDENPEKLVSKNTQTLDNQSSVTVSVEKDSDKKDSTPSVQPHPIYNSSEDLKVIEGIGPKIEMILKEAGIENWHQLSEVNIDNLKGILEKAGPRFRLNDPSTWAQQAQLLSEGSYDKFKALTDSLVGGKVAKS